MPSWCSRSCPKRGEGPTAQAARELLERVARQDVEKDDGKGGGVKIREGVAKDRVISTVDPEMRHGHKSSAGKWDGYKKHLSTEPQTELITAVEVTAANVNDGEVAMALLERQAEAGLCPSEAVGDNAYGSAELRAKGQAHGAGTTMVTKASGVPDTGYFHKSEFTIDLEASTVTCPAGQVVSFPRFRSGHSTEAVFPISVCAACPFRRVCTWMPSRTITIHPFEDQLQAARRRRAEPDFEELMRQRPTVERKQSHWNQRGGRHSRYVGLRKTRLQALWSAAEVNIERLIVIGEALAGRPNLQLASM